MELVWHRHAWYLSARLWMGLLWNGPYSTIQLKKEKGHALACFLSTAKQLMLAD